MPYCRIWVHLIWATKNRSPFMIDAIRPKIFHHLEHNAKEQNIFLDTVGGIADHVHTLIALRSSQSISTVARLLKGESSYWINNEKLIEEYFEWQDEYIAVSVSDSKASVIRRYIKNQVEHHRTQSSEEEFQQFLHHYGFAKQRNKPAPK